MRYYTKTTAELGEALYRAHNLVIGFMSKAISDAKDETEKSERVAALETEVGYYNRDWGAHYELDGLTVIDHDCDPPYICKAGEWTKLLN